MSSDIERNSPRNEIFKVENHRSGMREMPFAGI